jgi:hypothetical protein
MYLCLLKEDNCFVDYVMHHSWGEAITSLSESYEITEAKIEYTCPDPFGLPCNQEPTEDQVLAAKKNRGDMLARLQEYGLEPIQVESPEHAASVITEVLQRRDEF